MGKSGLLDFALTIITAENSASDLQVQAFRLIGNSCADTGDTYLHQLDRPKTLTSVR